MNNIDADILELEAQLSELKWKREVQGWAKFVGLTADTLRKSHEAHRALAASECATHVCCQSGAVMREYVGADISALSRPLADKIWPAPQQVNELFEHRPENVAPFPAETFPNIESNVDRLIANMDKYWGRPADYTIPDRAQPWPGYDEYHGV